MSLTARHFKSYKERNFSLAEADDLLKLLKFHDQGYIKENLAEIRKKYALCETEGPEHQPTQRTMRVLNSTDRLRAIEAAIRLSVDNECKEQRTAAASGCLQTVTVTKSEKQQHHAVCRQ